MSNPFLAKKFYLFDSNKQPYPLTGQSWVTINTNSLECPTFSVTSTITTTSNPQNNNLIGNSQNPMSALDINNYILKLVADFAKDSSLGKQCDTNSRYKGPYKSSVTCCSGSDIQPICSQIFKNFTSPEYRPNSDYYSNNQTSGPRKFVLSDFIYVDSSKKSLCQQYNDISGLIADFSNIVLGSLASDISNYKKSIINNDQLSTNYANMISLRNTVDLQLQNILHIMNY
jgi:hypothetical protein